MTYAAIGDSYAAGVGAGHFLDSCARTDGAYPRALARSLGLHLHLGACLGATAVQTLRDQVPQVAVDARLVTISAGGNDLDFTAVLTECAKPAWLGDSGPVLDAAAQRIRELPVVLEPLYRGVRERVPSAAVVVTGYPRLFGGEDCQVLTFFSPEEIRRLNLGADRVAAVMTEVCGRTGVRFVDVRASFSEHEVCEEPAWIHGVSWPLEQSFHPNGQGYAAYTRDVLGALGRPPVPEAPEPTRTYGPCAVGPKPVFQPPDLESEESVAAAREWGLDGDEVRDLARRARPTEHVGEADPDAVRRLRELDAEVRARRHQG